MKIIKRIDIPGKYEFFIPFDKKGLKKEWAGFVDARQVGEYELRVIVDHTHPNTEGKITVKAVVGRGSIVRLAGLIKIAKTAQMTNDFLELRVLLIDEQARGFVQPELEIEANNVKASHAASVGKIDEEQLMYLMSRGMKREKAEELIVEGFLLGE